MSANSYFQTDNPPVLQGVEYLDNISENEFPLYYKPLIKGVPTYLKEGLLFIAGTKKRVKNIEVINILKPIRRLSWCTKFCFDITFTSSALGTELYDALLSKHGKLPEGYTVHIMDVVNAKMKTQMHNLARNSILKAFKKDVKDAKNVYLHDEEMLHGVDDLYHVIEASSTMFSGLYGAKLSKLKSYYDQSTGGTPDAVIIDLEVHKEVDTIRIHSELGKFRSDGCNTSNLADNFTIVDGNSIRELDLSQLPKKVRKKIWDKRHDLMNKKVKLEYIEIPSRQKLIVKRILTLNA